MPRKSRKAVKPKKVRRVNRPRKTNSTAITRMPRLSINASAKNQQICSVTNPFCPAAIGARWPDDSFMKSVSFSIPGQQIDGPCDSNGNGCLAFFPQPNQYNYALSIDNATKICTFQNNNVALQTFPGGQAMWRLTSYGLKISCKQPRMTAQGMVHIRVWSGLVGSTFSNVQINSTLASSSIDVPVSRLIDKDIFVLPTNLGSIGRLFRSIGTEYNTAVLADWVNPGWQIITVGVTGGVASSSAAVTVSAYYHYEIVPEDNSSTSSLAIAPPADDALVRTGRESVFEKVGNFVEGAAKTVDTVVQSTAAKYLALALSAWYGNPGPAMIQNAAANRSIKNVD